MEHSPVRSAIDLGIDRYRSRRSSDQRHDQHSPWRKTRSQAASHDARRRLFARRYSLVCLDQLAVLTPQPLATNFCWRSDRSRHTAYQHARNELHRGLLRDQCQFRNGRHHFHALAICVWISNIRQGYICFSGRSVGDDCSGGLWCGSGSSACAILLLWREHPCKEQVAAVLSFQQAHCRGVDCTQTQLVPWLPSNVASLYPFRGRFH